MIVGDDAMTFDEYVDAWETKITYSLSDTVLYCEIMRLLDVDCKAWVLYCISVHYGIELPCIDDFLVKYDVPTKVHASYEE